MEEIKFWIARIYRALNEQAQVDEIMQTLGKNWKEYSTRFDNSKQS